MKIFLYIKLQDIIAVATFEVLLPHVAIGDKVGQRRSKPCCKVHRTPVQSIENNNTFEMGLIQLILQKVLPLTETKDVFSNE